MQYNVRRWNPILIAIPDIGIGLMWGSLSNVVAFYGYLYTNSATDLAQIYSIAAIVGVITQLVVGILSDKTKHKWGRRSPWLVYGMILSAISVACWPLANSFTMFLILSGLSCTLVNVAQCAYYTMIMEVVDKDQIGLTNTFARTSGTLGVFLMSWLAGFFWSNTHPAYTFFVMATLMLLSTLFVVPTIIKERPENYVTREALTISLDYFKNKDALKLFTIAFLFFASNTVMVQMATPLFVKNYQFSEHAVGKLGIFQAIASLIFGFTAFKLIDKIGSKRMFAISAMGLCITFMLLSIYLEYEPNKTVLYYGAFIYGLFFIAGNICIFTILSMVAPKNKLGKYMGLLNLCIALPQFIFSNIFSYLLDLGYYKSLMPIAATLYFFAFLITLAMKIETPDKTLPGKNHDPI